MISTELWDHQRRRCQKRREEKREGGKEERE
jgi:hypothetical protein